MVPFKKNIAFLFLCFSLAATAQKKPNIIFILADDMGYSDLGCYGSEIKTPNLDRVANEGIKMRTFYNNARCCPTRASLLTGRYPHAVGMGLMVTTPDQPVEPGPYQGFLDHNTPTIAELLKKAGYHTYMSGKWHVGERPQDWPRKRGFDRYYGLISGASSFYEITPQEKAKRFFVSDDQIVNIPATGFYATDAYTDSAIAFLKSTPAQDPFFLYLAYTAPHYPLHAPEEDIVKYENLYAQGWDIIRQQRYAKQTTLGMIDARYALTPKMPTLKDWAGDDPQLQWVRKMAVHAAMVDRLDQNMGKLIQFLKSKNKWENTLLVFLSDNGASAEKVNMEKLHDPTTKIGARGSYASIGENWANVSNTPFKRYKHFIHEGGINTPMILHWPAVIQPHKGFTDGVGHVIDLLPTAMELAGIKNVSSDGMSLSYLWNGQKQPERTIFWEHENNWGMRKGKWKLVKENDEMKWSLFNMQQDPTEMKDLSLSMPDLVSELSAEYTAWSAKMGVKNMKKGGE